MHQRALPVLMFLGSLLAQEPTPAQSFAAQRARLVADATTQLQSKDVVQVAWGTFAVAELRLHECVPEVRKVLRDRPWGGVTADVSLTRALLDALIQTEAVVPPEELEPHLAEGAPTIVLMSRNAKRCRHLLLRVFSRATDACACSAEWIACGNLLAAEDDPEFVRALLRLPTQVWITVRDPGAEVEGVDGDAYGSACGRVEATKQFPPAARYQFWTGADHGFLVAAGRIPVHGARTHCRPGAWQCTTFRGYPEYRDARRAWFEDVLGEAGKPLVEALDRPRIVDWKDVATFRIEVATIRRKHEEQWRALVAVCVAKKLVAMDSATEPLPACRLVGVDVRVDQTVPLPDGIGAMPW